MPRPATRPATPAPTAREPSAPPPPAVAAPAPEPAAAKSALAKLEQTLVQVTLEETPLLDVLGTLSAKSDVAFYVSKKLIDERSAEELTIQSLRFDTPLPASQVLALVTKLSGLKVTSSDTRIVVHGEGEEIGPTTPLVEVPRKGKSK